jgi:polyisoprenoid-binding protein YceI
MKKAISLLAAATLLIAGSYDVDPVHTHVGFSVKHMMISHVDGQFDSFSGMFEYDEKTKTLLSLEGVVDVNSINTKNKTRDDDLRSATFFDAAKYPKLTYKLNTIKNGVGYGILTMHGVSKEIRLETVINGTIKDPWGNTRTGMSLSGVLNRKDFGLTYNKLLETGGLAVDDMIKLNIEIEGILKK